jgi:hypothetical protein
LGIKFSRLPVSLPYLKKIKLETAYATVQYVFLATKSGLAIARFGDTRKEITRSRALSSDLFHIEGLQLYKHRSHHYNARSFEVPGV